MAPAYVKGGWALGGSMTAAGRGTMADGGPDGSLASARPTRGRRTGTERAAQRGWRAMMQKNLKILFNIYSITNDNFTLSNGWLDLSILHTTKW